MTTPPHSGRRGAPIAIQLMGLLLLTLIVAQILTFIMLVMTPPPAPAFYRLEEIAKALKGGELTTRAGHPLVRTISSAAPVSELPLPPWPPGEDPGLRLSGLMSVSPSDVVVLIKPPPARWPHVGPDLDFGRPHEDMHRPPRGPHMVARIHMMNLGGGVLMDNFIAGARRSDGRWVIVQPGPSPFPNEWHKRVLLWLAGCVLLTAPLGYLFAKRITAPIQAFAEAAEALGRDPTSSILTLKGPAEIGAAASAFNNMQARLKRFIEDRTGMVGAISHDMRTPLARIRFKIEAAPPKLRSAVLADVEQMEQMITSVLAFIRDASAGRPREPVDLRSILECLVDDADQMGQSVQLEDGDGVTVTADSLGLTRLFSNLLENAVKYGGGGNVRLYTLDHEAIVEITDQGPGLPETELERVFTPFYRAESARTLDGGGVGLGLAVARSIARAHGGDVVLTANPEGLTAKVRLPL